MLLVTGITGHTGRYFLQELIDNKYEGPIRCIVRESSDTSLIDNSGLNIEKIVGNLNSQEFINKSMVGVNTVMHIYNIHHSPMIVKAAINNNVKRAILIHTTGIYSKFKDASEGYKNIEKKVADLTKNPNCPTKVTILRPTMIYGDLCDHNMSKFIKMIDVMKIYPLIAGGDALIQPVNARDLGKAYYSVLMNPEKTVNKQYNLSGNEPIPVREALKIISEYLDKNTIYISIPMGLSLLAAKIIKTITLGKLNIVEKVQRMGEDRSYSNELARNDFNFNPMSFDEGIKIEIDQFKNRHI